MMTVAKLVKMTDVTVGFMLYIIYTYIRLVYGDVYFCATAHLTFQYLPTSEIAN